MNIFAKSLATALKTTTSLESVDVDINLGDDAIEADQDNLLVDDDGAAISPLAPATDEPIIEAQETEAAAEENGVDETTNEIVETEGEVETLESIQLLLQKSLTDEGAGLSVASFEMFNVNMNHIYRKYGITSATVMPSMEAFSEDQKAQTVVSLEKVSDTIKTIGEGAKELLKKLWFKIKNFALALIKLNLSMQKRVDAIAAKAKSIGDDSKKEDIKLYSGNRLNIAGKVPAKNVILQSYAKTVDANLKLANVADSYLNVLSKAIADIVSTQTVNESQDLDRIRTAVRAPLGYFSSNGNFPFQDAKFVKGMLDPKDTQMGGLKFETAKAPERGQDSEGYKVTPLTCSEIEDVCAKITESIKSIKEMSELHTRKEIEKQINELIDQKTASPISAKMDVVVSIAIRQALGANSKVISYVNSINKAMLDYCAQSLNAYGGKSEAKSEDKPSAD